MKNVIPHTNINLAVNANLAQMFQDIEKFYSIDNRIDNIEYSGYKLLTEKISDKIDLLIKGEVPFPCSELINKIKSRFATLQVKSELERQFPSYAFSIVIQEKDLGQIIVINSLKIRISLLSKFFTVFHEEKIIHKGITHNLGFINPVTTNLLSSQSLIIDPNNNYFDEIIKIIGSVFSGYTFVRHELLFKRNIKDATPHGVIRISDNEEFSLYSFLFETEYQSFKSFYVAP